MLLAVAATLWQAAAAVAAAIAAASEQETPQAASLPLPAAQHRLFP
jgi:hypothetical protein